MVRSRESLPVAPPHPGWILRDRVLPGLGLSVSQAARELRIARQTLHRVLAGTAAVSPEMATRLARLSGTTPQFWLDRKSTRLNSSHANISYAVFCLKKKKINIVHSLISS